MDKNKGGIILILGGARSGKSGFAEKLAAGAVWPVTYLATGKAVDEEMRRRIERHQKERPPQWRTIEVDGDLPRVLERVDEKYDGQFILDCLTIYTADLLKKYDDERELISHINKVMEIIKRFKRFIIVSNEVGMGLVPPYPLGRCYRDILGKVNQTAAAAAGEVYLMTAGIPVKIKGQQ